MQKKSNIKSIHLVVLFFLAGVLCCPKIYAAQVDSIASLIKKEANTLKRIGLENVKVNYDLAEHPKQAFYTLNKLLVELQTQELLSYDSLMLEVQYSIGMYYSVVQEFDSVIQIQNRVYKEAKAHQYKLIAAKSLVELGIAKESLGDYENSLLCYIEALKLFEELKNDRGVLYQYINLGLIYQYQNKYKRAIVFFNKAIEIANKIGLEDGAISAYNNLGIVYQSMGQLDKALTYFTRVLVYDLKSGDSSHIADSYNNVGLIYFNKKDYSKAEDYFLKSAQIKITLNDREGLANTANNLGETYINYKTDRALKWLNEAQQIALELKLKAILLENYRVYTLYYKAIKNYAQALSYFEKYDTLKDSLKLDELNLKIEQVQHQYDSEKSARLLSEKDAEIKAQSYEQRILIIVVISCITLVVFMYLYGVKTKWLNKQLVKHQQLISETNQQLQAQVKETNLAKEHAEHAAKAKSQFLSTMSHEIRTPLNAIIGIGKLLGETATREEHQKNVLLLQQSSKRLLDLLNDILDLTKLESGKVLIENVSFNLKDELKKLIQLHQLAANDKNLLLELTIDNFLPSYVNGDLLHLTQVLDNLLNNALKFTMQGKVTLDAKVMAKTSINTLVRFEVKDTGIGIPQDKLKLIFEEFTQADSNTTRKFGGTGLGLTICKSLLALHGAELNVRSTEGKGSTFYFELDFSLVNEMPTLNAIEEAKTEPNITLLKNVPILVAEDNNVNQFVIKQYMSKWGVDLTIVDNGKEAVELALKNDYALILMDVNMPVMDGLDASKIIIEQKPDTKIVALTATREEELTDDISGYGIIGVITKPFEPLALAEYILKCIS